MAAPIDLSKVPVPDVIEALDFETIFIKNKQQLIALNPDYASVLELESEPLTQFIELVSYKEMHLIAKINDGTRANMLASAASNDLDAIAARYNIDRLTLHPENNTVNPSIPAVMESDDAFKRRIQLAFDGLNTAGSDDAYVFHALTSHANVKDAFAFSPAPSEMVLTILSHEGSGTPSNDTLIKVRNYFGLNDVGDAALPTPSKVRPGADKVVVNGAQIQSYQVTATLDIPNTPSKDVIIDSANKAVIKYTNEQHKLNSDVTLSGIYAALHQPGVTNVNLTSPVADIVCANNQAPYCTSISVTGS